MTGGAGDHPAGDAELDDLLRRAAAAPVSYPSGLVNRSLDAVRTVRAEHPFELRQDGGVLRVSVPAVTAVARRLAAEFCAALGGLRPRDVRASATEIAVHVQIGYGTSAESAEQLAAALAEALRTQIGPAVPPVVVHLDDVYLPDTSGQSV